MRILLADDHALFRDGVASLLGAWGHEVVGQAADGPAAPSPMAHELAPDLVLMDVAMPGRRDRRHPPDRRRASPASRS